MQNPSMRVARQNMILNQLKPDHIRNNTLLNAFSSIPRELFVPHSWKPCAYSDQHVIVKDHHNPQLQRRLPSPRTLASLIQLANVSPSSLVLDIAPASGYSSAVLAAIAHKGHVVALEDDQRLADDARVKLQSLHIHNVQVVNSPIQLGAPQLAPFNSIILNGSAQHIPQTLLDQLALNGNLAAVISQNHHSQIHLFTKSIHHTQSRVVTNAGAPPLPQFNLKPRFSLQ